MIDKYIIKGVSNEDHILQQAIDRSYNGELVQVHWHSAKLPCEAKFDHAIYKDGFANKGGSGQA